MKKILCVIVWNKQININNQEYVYRTFRKCTMLVMGHQWIYTLSLMISPINNSDTAIVQALNIRDS